MELWHCAEQLWIILKIKKVQFYFCLFKIIKNICLHFSASLVVFSLNLYALFWFKIVHSTQKSWKNQEQVLMGHSKEKLEHQSLVTVRQTSILHSDFRGSIERVVLLCRKIVSSFVLLHIFISFLCCLAEKGQGEASKRLKIAEKLQSV